MTHRIGPLGGGFEPGSPAVRTVASTYVVGALPTGLNTTTTVRDIRGECWSEQ